MKQIIIPTILLLASCGGNTRDARENNNGRVEKLGQFYDEQEAETGMVWICTGKSSHAYHSNPECYGINACGGEKKEMTLEEAQELGRTPCHFCHGEEQIEEIEESEENEE